ncbi:MAG: RsiV family protein [Oscillospiraceae bacterium]|nr:RsiV family protein [Oscillospiraceae bacterium]MCL1952127.1 RsiV family protein [Oscillospiraceae bacterium]
MRKLLSFVCLCALACGLGACGKGEPYAPQFNGDSIPVVTKNVAGSKRVTNRGFLDLLERMRGGANRPLRKSWVFSRQQAYRGHWTRVVYYAYPRFTNEIKGPGAKRIKRYYKEQYKGCDAAGEFPWLDACRELTDSPEDMMRYRLQVYAADMPAGYVVVNFFREECVDGRRVAPAAAADVFDRETGARLSLGDVIDVNESAEAVNRAVANYLRVHDIRPLKPYDVKEARDQAFSLTEEGPVLLFAPGALAPEAYGLIQVPLGR